MIDASDEHLGLLARRVGAMLQERAAQVTLAESCTGGWMAKLLTDVAGSSAWFDRGFVTYSNAAKQELLGVRADVLAAHGAVSGQVVEQMALGALARSQAQFSIAVSGIAGPGGGSEAKPVGTVWLAWGVAGQSVATRCLHLAGDRDRVRRQAVACALDGLLLQAKELDD